MMKFGGFPPEYMKEENASVVILPIPYDGTSTWIKGSDKGPEALIEASNAVEYYDIETDSEPFRVGIFTAKPVNEDASPEAMTEAVYHAVKSYLRKGKFVVGLGGEHSVSLGNIRACREKYLDMSVLQIDAHTDLRETYEGSPYNHACVMARVQDLCPLVQVGIRSMDISEKSRIVAGRVFWAHEIHRSRAWMQQALGQLSHDVFITIDLDGFDPSVMPSTGTPEPGGLMWYETLEFLRLVIDKRNLVGFDVVELCPDKREKSSDFLAAKLVYKLIAYKFMSSPYKYI